MTDSAAQKVLSRKAQAARRAIEAQGMSVEKALRRALARTAEESWNLALIARNARLSAADQDDTTARLQEGDLILLLDGSEGALGFATLDRQAVTALVEVQTLGIVTDMPLDDRRLTPTDAAIAAPLVEGALGRLTGYLAQDPVGAQVDGFRFGAMVENARIAANLLAAPRYRVLEADIDLGGGLRQGRIVLALPDRKVIPTAPEGEEDAPPRHADLMMTLPAQIDAVLCRLRLPFAEAQKLEPGALLPLPAGVLDHAELVAGNGHRVTGGRLGQVNGQRAIRVTEATGARPAGTDPAPFQAGGAMDEDEGHMTEAPEVDAEAAPFSLELPSETGVEEDDLPELPPLDFDMAEIGGAEDDDDDFPSFASAMDGLDLPDGTD
ncbi:FliM/FliN family flagellar motor switch protein [Roseivivax sediminis]|uniref:Type III flagellar switch regulator (C-ring) FliN C-term n=1 Tax=Roseivivax sediminis TaxID=936889 RepID=A0A1I2ECQ1_9RHOB|nr:FliM/FliN family flagellar motor C-terminal domain-containing protein [Roseivivax sediminis]SFE90722.1 Type III flagellar switch regulator (C-ring) FliN C-term [Roseivivax sediminis]